MAIRQAVRFDEAFDVVVLGSGAAGLTAATLAADGGASVLVLEKTALLGGTSGLSGGVLWIPNNDHMPDLGMTDSREEALDYLQQLTQGRVPDPALLETYVDTAAEMIRYLEDRTPLRMVATRCYADYYADLPGGKRQGRSIEVAPFDAPAELGEWADRCRVSPYMPPLTLDEGGIAKILGGEFPMALLEARQKAGVRAVGAALVASLVKGLLDRSVALRTGASARELVIDDSGAVVGVRVADDAGDRYIAARQAVILATGGFECNGELAQTFLPVPPLPMGAGGNEGDGLLMAMKAGAALGNMNSAWWYPAMCDESLRYEGAPVYHLGMGRNMAGSLFVNRHGKRFTNEGAAYHDVGRSMHAFDPVTRDYPNAGPNWMIFDRKIKEQTAIMSALPAEAAPDWMPSAATLEELAERIGLPVAALSQTVERFNADARLGKDSEFARGTCYAENFLLGGPTPETSLAPVEDPPFYAVRVYNATLGTHGGPRIDRHARVLDPQGGVIGGLYAAGNVSAAVFGAYYPGGGATLGPAMTFGYIAGRHAASCTARQLTAGLDAAG
ncbi:MAG TPA: FAD-dependent oxidoreductase [Steroidobacter sp.]|uniref:FAD-dependent oxidoreductase n=1 Tax=Steroidobacter sp. TaxID=1978227 RepID=UPI002EDADF6C